MKRKTYFRLYFCVFAFSWDIDQLRSSLWPLTATLFLLDKFCLISLLFLMAIQLCFVQTQRVVPSEHIWVSFVVSVKFAYYLRRTYRSFPFLLLQLYFISSSSSSVMELGHLLTRSCRTCPETSSKVCHDSFCQSDSSVSLSWVICYEAFCLNIVSSFSCIPVIWPNLELFLTPLQFMYLFCNLSKCVLRVLF
jgi:hypothetical protein